MMLVPDWRMIFDTAQYFGRSDFRICCCSSVEEVVTAIFSVISAPILVQPFIDPADPTAAWTVMSALLLILAVVYAVLSRLGAKTTTE